MACPKLPKEARNVPLSDKTKLFQHEAHTYNGIQQNKKAQHCRNKLLKPDNVLQTTAKAGFSNLHIIKCQLQATQQFQS